MTASAPPPPPDAPSPLPRSFYERPTLEVARALLGMHLLRVREDGSLLRGRIVEVEAYLGPEDRASHARVKKRGGALQPFGRSVLMFGTPGVCYVYGVYGMHHCVNAVAHSEGAVGAVLIRALEPLVGAPDPHRPQGVGGPAKLCAALDIDKRLNGADLCAAESGLLIAGAAAAPRLSIIDLGTPTADEDVVATPRIGVDYAGEDALLPYRLVDRRSPHLSRPLPRGPRPLPRKPG